MHHISMSNVHTVGALMDFVILPTESNAVTALQSPTQSALLSFESVCSAHNLWYSDDSLNWAYIDWDASKVSLSTTVPNLIALIRWAFILRSRCEKNINLVPCIKADEILHTKPQISNVSTSIHGELPDVMCYEGFSI
jgi:hypothetical protein